MWSTSVAGTLSSSGRRSRTARAVHSRQNGSISKWFGRKRYRQIGRAYHVCQSAALALRRALSLGRWCSQYTALVRLPHPGWAHGCRGLRAIAITSKGKNKSPHHESHFAIHGTGTKAQALREYSRLIHYHTCGNRPRSFSLPSLAGACAAAVRRPGSRANLGLFLFYHIHSVFATLFTPFFEISQLLYTTPSQNFGLFNCRFRQPCHHILESTIAVLTFRLIQNSRP